MSRFNVNTNYPLIPNANEYMMEQRVVSIHSEDRDITKFPDSNEFEIQLPDDYTNVVSVKLGQYTFPANYNTFSSKLKNTFMSFQINQPYNPQKNGFYDPMLNPIYEALYEHINENYIAVITAGFYNPVQIATELTNALNDVVTQYIVSYFTVSYPDLVQPFIAGGGYNQFIVAYNQVKQLLYFGNKSSGFTFTNDSDLYVKSNAALHISCATTLQASNTSSWGLPPYLGFSRCPEDSSSNNVPGVYPRFTYGDAVNAGDNGYWLVPDPNYRTQTVYNIQAPNKINLMGQAYIYMEMDGFNTIDETSPYVFNTFTYSTNENNGVHNSAFAKIAVPTTPVSQWFDANADAVKIFYPPAERIRKIRLRIRYHDGQQVDFADFNYSFNLVFQVLRPQNALTSNRFNP
jgi:hypothetical protein